MLSNGLVDATVGLDDLLNSLTRSDVKDLYVSTRMYTMSFNELQMEQLKAQISYTIVEIF